MCKKRAAILARRSLIALCTARSSCSSSVSNGTLNLVRNLSVVSEREECQNDNGYHADNSVQSYQTHGGFSSHNQSSCYYQQHGQTASLQSRPYVENFDSFHTENSSSLDYGQKPISGLANTSMHESASRSYEQNNVGMPTNSSGFNQKHDEVYRETYQNTHHANPVALNGNFMENGYKGVVGQAQNSFNGNNSRKFARIRNNEVRGADRSMSQNIQFQFERGENFSAYNGYNNEALQQNNYVHISNSEVRGADRSLSQNIQFERREKFSAYNGYNNEELQQNNYVHIGNNEVRGADRSMSQNIQFERRENFSAYNGYNNEKLQQNNYGVSGQNSWGTWTESEQHVHGTGQNYHNPMSGANNHIPLSRQYQQNSISQQHPQGQYQQGVVVQQFQPYPDTNQSNMIGSRVLNTNADEEIGAIKDRLHGSTLEELDEFCREGKLKEAVQYLEVLEKQNIPVDLPRYIDLMNACGEARSLEEAKVVYTYVIKSQNPLEVSTYNKILEMYSKCGSMDDAYTIFNQMPSRNLTSWDTMITWLAKNGLGEDAIDLFYEFKKAGLRPDGKMFIGVFSACSILGDVNEGMLHFESMTKNYGITPSIHHYVSIVDMLGSIGYVDEALEFIEKMPLQPGVDIWETMMNISRAHGLIELGDRCFELVEHLDSSRLNEQSKAGLLPIKASELEKEKEKKKLANRNLLEVRSRVHEYRAGDTSHPENDRIYTLLRGLREQMKEVGYIPETRFVLHDIDQEGKYDALLGHSERLAVAYGLISSSARAPIRVIKNLRVCGDCHSALKIISKIVGRELIIRDAKRFHHFKDGLCSCRDYW